MELDIYMNEKKANKEKIFAWEAKRERRSLSKIRKFLGEKRYNEILEEKQLSLGNPCSYERKMAIAQLKLEMGHDAVFQMLGWELALSNWFIQIMTRLSKDKRKVSAIEIVSDAGNANQLVDWYLSHHAANDELSMLLASADHYLFQTPTATQQEIIEVTGGCPVAARFVANFGEEKGLVTKADHKYTCGMTANCVLENGSVMGGIRHQVRPEGTGFRAFLQVEFPGIMPGYMVRMHQYHLAVEFSNWIYMACNDALNNS